MTRPFYIVFTIYFSLLLLALANNSVAQKTIEFSFNDFDEQVELKGELLELEAPLMNPLEIILSDTLLFVKNSRANPAVDVISLNSGKTITKFCRRGRGPGELVAPFCIQYLEEEKKFMVQDIVGKKIVFFDLELILSNAPKKSTKTINFHKDIRVRKLTKMKGGDYFCNLMGHKDGYMNCILSPEGRLVKFLDKYPEIELPFNPEMGANIFSSRLGISSTIDKVILPYMYSDIISIYNSSGDKITEFKGPNYKKLNLVYSDGSTGRTYENNCAYNLPYSNSKTFMISYDGTKYKYAHSPAYHIFHFGFDGSLLQHFKLDKAVTNIAVDWKKKIIYGINKDLEPCIYKFKF